MEDLNYEETTKSLNELLRSILRSYVKDTTKNRAPAFYQAPDFSSEDSEKDFEEGMHILENDSDNWREGKKLLLKAAHNGHVRAQFMLGCFYRKGWNVYAFSDFTMAETWLQEAIQNGLSGEDLAKAKIELINAQSQRRAKWIRV